jgi:DNA-binding response OmpR family regulator
METKATILLVDDQPELLESLSLTLSAADYEVLQAEDGVEALELLEQNEVDLILADIAMPRLNGYQLYERVRQKTEWVAIPFLFLTARALDSDVRYGKELGVDDYLTKPIQPEDLLASVQGKLRRAQQLAQLIEPTDENNNGQERSIQRGSLQIFPDQRRVCLSGRVLKVSAKEFVLLVCLAEQSNKVIPTPEIVRETHGLNTDHTEAGALLRPLVRSLRRKFGYRAGQMGLIENVRGVGYRLIVPEA